VVRLLVHWGTVSIALWVADYLLAGVRVSSLETLVVAGLVLGLVNALVRPVLAFLAFPITLLTLGLFYLVVNGAAFGIAAWLVPGFRVDSVVAAILGALVVSVVSWFIGLFTGGDDDRERKKKKKRRRRDPD
jgi:putative membrane protein